MSLLDALMEAIAEEASMPWEEFRKRGGKQHTRAACRASRKEGAPKNCVIHNPSKHHMRDWPMILRSSSLIERQCPHGVGHPDPDSAAYLNWLDHDDCWGIHGCCMERCCAPQEAPGATRRAKATN